MLRGTSGQANTSVSDEVTVGVSGIGIQAGDIVLLLCGSGGGGSDTITFPAGFARPPSFTKNSNAAGSTDTVDIAWWAASGTIPSNLSCMSSADDYLSLTCRVYSGRNTTAPFAVTPKQSNIGSASMPITYSITGLTANPTDDVVLMIGGSQMSASTTLTYTPPSGFANPLVTAAESTTFSPILIGCDKVNASGATGTLGGTLSGSPSSFTYAYTGYLMSIAAASSGSGTPSQFFLGGELLPLAPLGWVIRRRIQLAKERRSKGGIILP